MRDIFHNDAWASKRIPTVKYKPEIIFFKSMFPEGSLPLSVLPSCLYSGSIFLSTMLIYITSDLSPRSGNI